MLSFPIAAYPRNKASRPHPISGAGGLFLCIVVSVFSADFTASIGLLWAYWLKPDSQKPPFFIIYDDFLAFFTPAASLSGFHREMIHIASSPVIPWFLTLSFNSYCFVTAYLNWKFVVKLMSFRLIVVRLSARQRAPIKRHSAWKDYRMSLVSCVLLLQRGEIMSQNCIGRHMSAVVRNNEGVLKNWVAKLGKSMATDVFPLVYEMV